MTTDGGEQTGPLAPSPRDGFEGKIALITGASRGIGRQLALTLAARGATPIVNYRRSDDAARETVAKIERLGATGVAIRADLENLDASAAWTSSSPTPRRATSAR
jgi:NAD(P)-dependent dehydrogenase (short-subunit alcohol dehydrogenase family)